jgi:hypothetical protein
MRPWAPIALLIACSCDASGTEAPPDGGGTDVTVEAPTFEGEGGSVAAEAGPNGEAGLAACVDLSPKLAKQWDDCVYAGRCPFDCAGGTASAYLCSVGPDASSPTYPSAFNLHVDAVDVVALLPAVYPWDASAYESCAALACTRWATADHVEGGSAWEADPCADGGLSNEAWVCPLQPGIVPAGKGCVAMGDLQRIGGAGTGIPSDSVWCCPPASLKLDGAVE